VFELRKLINEYVKKGWSSIQYSVFSTKYYSFFSIT
jgi:hypothetical protein